MKNRNKYKGFSLVEMIIVLAVFSVLAIIVTQALILSLRGAQKGRAIGSVRENLEFTLSVIERNLRNARSLDCTTSDHNTLNYTDEEGLNRSFSCVTVNNPPNPSDSFIQQGTSRLTNSSVTIVNCDISTQPIFTCTQGSGSPDSVQIRIQATDSTGVGTAEGASETFTTQISLRNY